MQIDVRTNGAMFKAQIALDAQHMKVAVRDSLNRAADRTKTATSKQIRDEYAIRKRDVDQAFSLRKATRDFLTAILAARGKPFSLYQFAPRPSGVVRPQRGAGVSVVVKKGKRTTVRGTFIARMKTGHMGVFIRKKGASRFPIVERKAPSVPGMLTFKHINEAIGKNAMDFFTIAMDQNIRRFARR